MTPNLFTLVAYHPDCDPVVALDLTLDEITSTALGLSPVDIVYAVPAQASHRTDEPDRIVTTHLPHVYAIARPGGFSVHQPHPAKWTEKVHRALDFNEREARRLRREAALAADKAKERARAVVLPHPDCPEFFELDQRARLVGA